ncbi:glycosyltransferase family 2 protein [Pedobacter sp. AW31-3R]|uniref:glycosyltransferase family 2 protein n=1 Tax=Pedobacter sp. AW31-3R TaxID=3445781 RepID=UPI003F9F241E
MEQPLISCIMPTANRSKFIPQAIEYFLNQDYKNAELIIIDDGRVSVKNLVPDHPRIHYFYSAPLGTIGIKRNVACEKANGELIMHWDDDDYYAPNWISSMTTAFLTSGADIAGLNRVLFFSPITNQTFMYEDTDEDKPWLCGATMTFRRSFWEKHPFADLQVGEDYDFVWNTGAKVFALDYLEGFVAILHPHNTSIKPVENTRHKKNPTVWQAPIDEK